MGASLLAVSTAACAQEAREFNIPSGSLRDGLNLFATQSDQQILFSGEAVEGLRTPGLRGRYAPSAALDRMLAGTGLVWSETRPGVIFLRRRDAGAGAVEQATVVDDVVVTGTLLKASGELASPVVMLDRDELDARGRGTVADVLTDLPQNYAGSGTTGALLAGADRGGSNGVVATGVNLRGLGADATLVLVNGRRLAGTGFRGEFADVSALPSAAVERVDVLLDGASALYGPHNTILDNCHVYTAFSALDPLTQDKVSKLTGSVMETRKSRSAPAGLGAGRKSVSRSEVERPLLEPGEIRALPDDQQLIFVAGQRPLRTGKLLYDRREPFRSRAGQTPPDQAARVDGPGRPPHPWLGRRSLGRDAMASLPLFKEVAGAMDDRKAAARAADIYGRVAQEMAAQQAVLDQLQGGSDGEK
ncbi:Coupling protein VirD4, ATPase required for T-DNA transfer [Brevundimonas diminuta 3F5N]|uniref:Coupling protein VirD4, ATPase required for T-DNA transfer n=1 Tax=Brevundimonas diminuta 3F5N TaxID=1255603 RepID=A0A1R4EQG0_BREDI|nr:Coupling protein VirD4, ATPase required for T-DNA transfer [Brevundimonas diminuta 3F5N]